MGSPAIVERIVVGPLAVNCYLYADSVTRDAVCIDPGDEAGRIMDAIRSRNANVKAILVTHAHADHIMAAHAVSVETGAPVIAPDGEQELWGMAAAFYAAWGFPSQQPPPPDRWIRAGAPIEAGSLTLDALDVRGHSAGGLAYAAPGVVFCGDALFEGSIGRTDLPGGDHATLIDHIRRNLLSLSEATVVYPGHGPETTVGLERRSNPYFRHLNSR